MSRLVIRGCQYQAQAGDSWEALGAEFFPNNYLWQPDQVISDLASANGLGPNDPVPSLVTLPFFNCDPEAPPRTMAQIQALYSTGNNGGNAPGGTRPRIVAGAPINQLDIPGLWTRIAEFRFSPEYLVGNQAYLIGGAGALVLLALLLKSRRR